MFIGWEKYLDIWVKVVEVDIDVEYVIEYVLNVMVDIVILQGLVVVVQQMLMLVCDIFDVLFCFVVICEEVCDLGNFGMIICVVDVVGVDVVVLIGCMVDLYNLKVVCVMIGLLFYLLVLVGGDFDEVV